MDLPIQQAIRKWSSPQPDFLARSGNGVMDDNYLDTHVSDGVHSCAILGISVMTNYFLNGNHRISSSDCFKCYDNKKRMAVSKICTKTAPLHQSCNEQLRSASTEEQSCST